MIKYDINGNTIAIIVQMIAEDMPPVKFFKKVTEADDFLLQSVYILLLRRSDSKDKLATMLL